MQIQERITSWWERCGAPLAIQGLHKSFGTNRVLKGIDLEVAPGEFLAIVGRGGCGKSTLLRLIAGLETPTEGAIRQNGEAVTGLQADTRILFQEAHLLPWQRVLDNVALGLKRQERHRAERALEQVGLRGRERDWPAILSGDRSSESRWPGHWFSHPRLMLLDEPLGALDALTRLEMQRLIECLWEEQRFTALLVTHDVDEAVALADRIIVQEEGQIVLETRVPLARPRHRSDYGFGEIAEEVLGCILSEPSHLKYSVVTTY
jgi:sulfonate transport system ATP-binding protein